MIIELNENNFYENISKGLKIVEFYTSWCGFCSKQNIILKEMSNIDFYGVNGEKSPELIKQFGIQAFPSFIIFKDGKNVHQFSGLHSKYELMNILMNFLKK